jgi:putative transposase
MEKIIHHPEFVTSTILDWKPLLKPDKYKKLILEGLRFHVKENRVILYAYVIMDKHLHLIWQIKGERKTEDVRRDFLKFISGKIKADLKKNHPKVLPYFKSSQADRSYHFWERKSLCIELFTREVFNQKLEYIHNNPVKAGMCEKPEDYPYSSARFYFDGSDEFNMLTHCNI